MTPETTVWCPCGEYRALPHLKYCPVCLDKAPGTEGREVTDGTMDMRWAAGAAWTADDLDAPIATPELSPTEAAIVARFDAAEPAPESYVQQHTSEPDCFCQPYRVGTLGVWTHRVVEP